MRMRIEKLIDPQALKRFVEERGLCVPVFFDSQGYLFIDVNMRNMVDATTLLKWLVHQ